MTELTGRTALVTGGTSGIGLGVVRRFVAEGAHVVVTAGSRRGWTRSRRSWAAASRP